MKTTKASQQEAKTRIISPKETEKDVEITLDQIKADEATDTSTDEASEEEIKAALDMLNPDEGSMESRG